MGQIMPEDRRSPEKWHLDKRVPIATLVGLVALAAGGMLFVTDMRKDVEVLRETQRAVNERIDRTDNLTAAKFLEVQKSLDKMDGKLDRLIERRP